MTWSHDQTTTLLETQAHVDRGDVGHDSYYAAADHEVRQLGVGSVITLECLAGERFDVLLNEHPFAHGEVVVNGEHMALRVTEMADVDEVKS